MSQRSRGQGWVATGLFGLDWKSGLGFSGENKTKQNKTKTACNAGDMGSIPRSGRSSGEGNGNILQYLCLIYSTDRGAWWASVHAIAKESDKT